jgi:hypothetical protein
VTAHQDAYSIRPSGQLGYPFRAPPPVGPLRLRLTPWTTDEDGRDAPHGGVWWPYTRDLAREGAHLVDDFPIALGKVDRLAYSPLDWDDELDHVFTRHGRIKVGQVAERRCILVRLVGPVIVRLAVVRSA